MPITPKALATAQRIAESAADLFFTNGYADTTIAQIAERAGVAVGTVMLHFGSKSDLATAAFANRIASTVEIASETITGSSIRTDLDAFVRPLFQWYDLHRPVVGELLKEALFSDGQWAAYYANIVENTVVTFTRIVNHHCPQDQAELVGESLLGIYLLVVLRGLSGRFASVDEQVEHFVKLALKILPDNHQIK